jgi:hypothetical protein
MWTEKWMGTWTDTTKLTGTFCKYVNALKKNVNILETIPAKA